VTTIDEELQLIKRGRAAQQPAATLLPDALSQLSQTFQQAVTPPPGADMPAAPDAAAPAAPEAAPRDIDAEMGLPAPEAGLETLPDQEAGFWEVAGASWQSETVKTDAWNYSESLRRDATAAIWNRLSAEAKQRIIDLKWDQENNWMRFEDLVVDEAAKDASSSPERAADYAGVPLSKEAFEQQIMGQRKAALAEAEGVLKTSDRWFAEFVGAGARAMTDETSLMLLPFGVSGSAWRTIAGEALLGAIGEAAILPREFDVAEELGLADPDPVERILLGAALGGGLSAGILGVVKGISHLRARRAGVDAARLDGDDALDAEIAVEENDAAMRGDQTVAEVINASRAAPGTMPAILADTGAATDGAFNEAAVLRAIIGVESGGRADAQAATSSARGLGQFISSTWMAMIQKHRPDLLQGRTPNQVLALRDDPQLNAQMTLQFMRDNRAALQSQGLPAGPGETYLAHFMGVGGASRALRAPLETPITAVMDAKAIAANRGIRHNGKSFDQFTVFDLRQWANAKMRRASAPGADADMPVYSGPTSRGYTGSGQVAVGDRRIDVEYVVVDASTLTRASGEFQPRDRSRGASDAWIADTAARLDPAQLMPSPTADRGAPIIGPDNMIESGNGRYGAIVRAYERFPDRAAAYRGQIEAAGFAIPEGVSRPVLVARRTTDLTRDERIQLTVDAQDSGVALMSPTELAQVQARAMTPDVLAKFNPAASLDDAANAGFVRAVMDMLPRSVRGAMIDAKKILNANGRKQLRDALFARAWNDPDVIEMFAEADAGELRSLLDALETAAPNWAALKADIEAGLVRPEMDISGHVLDAMRLIANARKIAAQEQARRAGLPKGARGGFSIGDALTELLDDVDLIAGPVAPLTAALVRKFWTGGKAAPAGQVASFLTRYADDARKVGQGGGLFGDAPGPRDVLQAIDGTAFADLPADLGPVRGFARPNSGAPEGELPPQALPDEGFDTGASSPEAQAVQAEIRAELEGPPARMADDGAQPDAEPPQGASDASDDMRLAEDAEDVQAALDRAEIDAARAEFAEFDIDLPDGTSARLSDVLADLDQDAGFDAFVQACALSPIGGAA
jgi:hypothetical protein